MDPRLIEAYERQLGLKPVFVQRWLVTDPDARPLRVASVERGRCSLLTIDVDGQLVERHAQPGEESVTVGDWVLLEPAREPARIGTVLERESLLRRGSAKREGEAQLIAANLDLVFIVAAFSETEKLERRTMRARRLDRFISAVLEGGAQPVVVLNKSDLTLRDASALRVLEHTLTQRLGGVPVILASAHAEHGLRALSERILPGATVAFIGPSGVGKSSLINRLLGENRQSVGMVRERDTKGRHTTTRRQLLRLPSGALLIDTPGVREFAVLADESVAGFADLDELSLDCRFSDCSHESEPGCAVRAAVERGELAIERVASFRDLEHDAARLRAKHDAYGRHLERAEGRRFGRLVRTLTAVSHKPPR